MYTGSPSGEVSLIHGEGFMRRSSEERVGEDKGVDFVKVWGKDSLFVFLCFDLLEKNLSLNEKCRSTLLLSFLFFIGSI